jgi:hypothetical protein
MSNIFIKNADTVAHTWCGQEIQPADYYQIQDIELVTWQSNSSLLIDIANAVAVVAMSSDGTGDITDFEDALDYLKKNYVKEVTLSGLDRTVTEKALKTCPIPMEGSSSLLISQNFCNKTTWFNGSTRVTGETLSGDIDGLVYSSAHAYWIDLSHGKVPYEDRYITTYGPKIYVDGVLTESGFTINYTDGTVTFDASQSGKVVTATYSYAVDNTWTVSASSGKILKLLRTYTKITADVEFPENMGISYRIYTTYMGTPDVLISQTLYKSITDFIVCANRTERIEAWTGMDQDIITFYFDYVTSKEIYSSQGTYIKLGVYKIVDGELTFTEVIPGTFAYMIAECLSLTEST